MDASHPDSPDAQRPGGSSMAVFGLALCTLLSSLSNSIANVGLPTFERVFSASFQQVQWVVLVYLLTMTALVVSVGRFGDLVGRRRLLLGGIVVFTVASVACGVATSLWALVVARGVQGIGAAMMLVLALALVSESVPGARTGRAMGILGTVSAVGTALGPSLGGLLIDRLGWPALFLLTGLLAPIALVLVACTLPADRAQSGSGPRQFDLLGTVILAATLVAYALATTPGARGIDSITVSLLAIAAVGLALFVRIERRAKAPLVRLALFQMPMIGAGVVMNLLVTSVVMASLVVGPFYLAGAFALDPTGVGVVMSLGPVTAAVVGIPAGRWVDHRGATQATLAALVGMLAGSTAIALLPMSLGVAGYALPLALVTASYALFQAANNTAVIGSMVGGERGVVSGLLSLSRNLGLITGASLIGAVFAHAATAVDATRTSAAAVHTGLRASFALAAGLVGVALVIALASRANRSDH